VPARLEGGLVGRLDAFFQVVEDRLQRLLSRVVLRELGEVGERSGEQREGEEGEGHPGVLSCGVLLFDDSG